MPRPSIFERASKYVAVMPPAVSGSAGHNATFAAACALVKGFDLSIDEARPILQEFNARCAPAWSERDLEHKLSSADKSADDKPRGYLAGENGRTQGDDQPVETAKKKVWKEAPKPEYNAEKLAAFAGDWAGKVDLIWLANRSECDPAEIGSDDFLYLMYGSGEKVIWFDKLMSQGQGVWPDDDLPGSGREGVWILPQPVDGEYHPNPRTGKPSRRSEESITNFRWMILESDDAPVREWLGAIAQLPLRIGAIFTSGSRSVHALVRMDCPTARSWNDKKEAMAPGLRFLIENGADKGVLRAVQPCRLPGQFREGKRDKAGNYVRFDTPQPQKLLYVNTNPVARKLIETFPKRDVEAEWLETAKRESCGFDPDEVLDDWVLDGLRFYANRSAKISKILKQHAS